MVPTSQLYWKVNWEVCETVQKRWSLQANFTGNSNGRLMGSFLKYAKKVGLYKPTLQETQKEYFNQMF